MNVKFLSVVGNHSCVVSENGGLSRTGRPVHDAEISTEAGEQVSLCRTQVWLLIGHGR